MVVVVVVVTVVVYNHHCDNLLRILRLFRSSSSSIVSIDLRSHSPFLTHIYNDDNDRDMIIIQMGW